MIRDHLSAFHVISLFYLRPISYSCTALRNHLVRHCGHEKLGSNFQQPDTNSEKLGKKRLLVH